MNRCIDTTLINDTKKMINEILDISQRREALEPGRSFIVQAPAGSGKTALLTQRFLVLLATVKEMPEEVVAITFTRKAASEMRERIIKALSLAQADSPPQDDYALETWQLSKAVLARNERSKWQLLENPNRLRILTIDALCARIAAAAPLLSQLGSLPQVVEDAYPYYEQAARSLLTSWENGDETVEGLAQLLLHLDNNFQLVESLLIGMLSRRDQWLPYLVHQDQSEATRKMLETGLKNIIVETLCQLEFTQTQQAALIELATFAGKKLSALDSDSNISACHQLKIFPQPAVEHLPFWLGIAELLLTKSFEWRKTVNKNCGFPPASDADGVEEAALFKDMKSQMLQLLNSFSNNEILKAQLKDILLLPPPVYAEQQWQLVKVLIDLLPMLVAHLYLIFRDQNVIDFIGIAQGAKQALGEMDNPSDAALYLDYRIQHLLIDEFQDTSLTQYRLLLLLTAGWQPEDGRTLFLVGDPMQSIYRFREADVGLFLKVKKDGLGDLRLHPLQLTVNFRSTSPIVAWFNQTFQSIFPKEDNIERGAISFAPSAAFDNTETRNAITIHPVLEGDNEAEQVISLIRKSMKENPEDSIGILVRSRTHLTDIIQHLKTANISYQAVEIDRLIYATVVQDLFSLTKALMHLGCRLSWLSILRAPWCGIELTDLWYIANYNHSWTLWKTLQNYKDLSITETTKKRLSRIIPVLAQAIEDRSRLALSARITYTWYALGGPACIEESEHDNAVSFLHLLESFDEALSIDFSLLERKLFNTYTRSGSPDANLHLMTIHKAKGLEFDMVIIPGLERLPAIDQNHLLLWLERQNQHGETDLILAPIKAMEDEFDPIYRYLKAQHSIRAQYETSRLLYVAVTRAKRQLHLLGSVEIDVEKNMLKSPTHRSFLALLWEHVQSHFERLLTVQKDPKHLETESLPESMWLERLQADWQLPEKIMPLKIDPPSLTTNQLNWSLPYLQHVGTVLHQIFQKLSQNDLKELKIDFCRERQFWQKKLVQLGISSTQLAISLELIEKGVRKTLNDERGLWILNHQHRDAQCEFAISHRQEGSMIHSVIDRTFVDENDVRWIIDYKTADYIEDDITKFLATAKSHYASQLEAYANAISQLDSRQIKLGLYFPLFSGWCEWDFESNY